MQILLRKLKYIIITILFFTNCKKKEYIEIAPLTLNKTLLVELVNNYRTQGCNCGNTYYEAVDNIEWNDTLEIVAKNHADDMTINNYFSHTGLDGSNIGDRISKSFYYWTSCGENIAMGYATEQKVIEAWIKSEGHCKNIMNKNFKHMGISTSGKIWVQVFASH